MFSPISVTRHSLTGSPAAKVHTPARTDPPQRTRQRAPELTPSSHVLGRPGVRERGFHARLGLRHEEVTVDTLSMAALTMAALTMATLTMATCTVDTLTMALPTMALLTMGSACAMKNCFS